MMRLLSLSLLLLFFFYSCQDQETEIKIDGIQSLLVVDGVLISGRKAQIKVGRSNQVLNDSLSFRVPSTELSVTVYENGNPFLELSPEENSFTDSFGLALSNATYVSKGVVTLKENSSYHIELSADKFPKLVSRPQVFQSMVDIVKSRIQARRSGEVPDRCTLVDQSVILEHDRATDKYFILTVRNKLDGGPSRILFTLADEGFDDVTNPVIYPLDQRGHDCTDFSDFIYEVTVIPQEYYDFIRSRDLSLLDLGGLFSVPDQIPNNVENGYGYFGIGATYDLPWEVN